MRKTSSFTKLFSFYFVVIMAVTAVIFVVIGIAIINSLFDYYVEKIHAETQQMLAMKISTHYMMYKSWDGFDAKKIADEAQTTGDYFTLTDLDGKELFSGEQGVKHNIFNTGQIYRSNILPVLVEDQPVANLRVGYFVNNIMSVEADAYKNSGVFLIIFSISCIGLIAVLVSILFFYRLSKPIRHIASNAKAIAAGHWQSRIEIQSNVAEMHEIADAINMLSRSLLNQEKFRQQLIVELSHELRTPLQILLNQIEAILDGIYEADDGRLESMHAEITRVAELLNELEDRLIYENGNFDLNIALANISEVARKIAIGYEGGFAQKGLDFSYDIESNLFASVDTIRFAQVLINLLSNALKYTASGQVCLALKRIGNRIEISVSDTGEGIDQERIDHIDQRGAQDFKSVNSKGVGLYIAKLIIDKHGWEMRIDSQKNMGTLVTIVIQSPE